MKLLFWCDSGANVYSQREEEIELEDWGLTVEQWEAMSEDERYDLAKEWAWDTGLEVGVRELHQ